MVAIKATFDGEKIILPPGIRPKSTIAVEVPVTVQFPDDAIVDVEPEATADVGKYGRYTSIWDFINDDYRPAISLDERLRELNEDRDAWGEPHGDSKARCDRL